MSEFAFLNRNIERIRADKQRMEEIRRDGLKRKLKHLSDDCEQAQDYCRDLIRSGADVSEELNEMETTARGLLLVALLLKREGANG